MQDFIRMAVLVMPLAFGIGCSATTSNTFRGQSPNMVTHAGCGADPSGYGPYSAGPHTAYGDPNGGFGDPNGGYGDPYGGYGASYGGFPPPVRNNADPLHPRWDSKGLLGPKPVKMWNPTHHHTYDYKMPKDLAYPADNQPPAVVQYPYYTVKGPTDFFYKGP